jgi:L-iditol 2-dehydrogenase
VKALRRQSHSPRDAAVQDCEQPEPGEGQVRLKVSHCGICGSDLHAWLNHPGYESVLPEVTFGHELSATIDSLGPGVTDWQLGQAVTMIAVQGCLDHRCVYCSNGQPQLCMTRRVQGLHLDGGMAEYLCVSTDYLLPLPTDLDMLSAALTEPLSVAVHCVENCSRIQAGDKVIVSGPGIIGMLCAITARHLGADVCVVGTDADEAVRLSAARAIGFTTLTVGRGQASLAEQYTALTGREADVLIEASGASPALASAWESVRRDGSISVVALYGQSVTMDVTQFVRKQLAVFTSYASAPPSYERALDMLKNGVVPVNELVKVYDLSDGIQAFDDAEHQRVMKPVLRCS